MKATKNKRSKHVIVEENRSEVNFELVERLAEREEREWTYFGPAAPRAVEEASRYARRLIEADRLEQQLKKRRAQRRGTPQQ